MTRGRGPRRRVCLGIAAALVGALVLAAPLEAVAAPRAVRAATAKQQKKVRRFVKRLANAIRMGDGEFLLEHLHPEVFERYGEDACREHADGLQDEMARLRVRKVKGPDVYEWMTDGVTTDVPKVFSVDVDQTLGGQDVRRTIHVTTKAWFTDCGAPADSLIAGLKAIEGTYRGPWTNTTFGSSGTAEATLAVDVDTGAVRVTLALTGNVFGVPAPAPETVELQLGSAAAGQPIQATSTLFGPVTATLQPDQSLVIEANDVPAAGIATFRMVVTMSGTTIDATYTVGFEGGGSAQGTAMLTKV